MRSKYALCFAVFLFAVVPNSQAQSKPEKPTTFKDVGKAFSDLFHKKKTTPDNGNKNASNNTPANARQASTNANHKNKPIGDIGKLAANVKYIDADVFQPFDAGAALVLKGSSTAMIGPDGSFIVPYNKYQFMFEDETGFGGSGEYIQSGIFKFFDNTTSGGFIDAKGKLITTAIIGDYSFDYTPDKSMLISNAPISAEERAKGIPRFTYITPDGNKYTINYGLGQYSEGIGVVGNAAPLAYAKLDGKKVTGNLFDQASAFSDGMALVGKADAFGQMKYGFINNEGKLVIPFNFSIAPHHFSFGYAKVFPRDKSAFEYAFINKKGEIVFKQTKDDVIKYGQFSDFNYFGMAYSGNYFLTTDLKIISKADFFTSFGIPAESWIYNASPSGTGQGNQYGVEGEKHPKLYFTTQYGIDPVTGSGGLIGFIDLTTKKVVMPGFSKLGSFDPVSHLAYAEANIGKDSNGMAVVRRGYVNEQGEFVIVQGAGSKW